MKTYTVENNNVRIALTNGEIKRGMLGGTKIPLPPKLPYNVLVKFIDPKVVEKILNRWLRHQCVECYCDSIDEIKAMKNPKLQASLLTKTVKGIKIKYPFI